MIKCASVTFLATYIMLMCCENIRRSHPGNLVRTGVLTLAIGYMVYLF
jgi:hypothetical protein